MGGPLKGRGLQAGVQGAAAAAAEGRGVGGRERGRRHAAVAPAQQRSACPGSCTCIGPYAASARRGGQRPLAETLRPLGARGTRWLGPGCCGCSRWTESCLNYQTTQACMKSMAEVKRWILRGTTVVERKSINNTRRETSAGDVFQIALQYAIILNNAWPVGCRNSILMKASGQCKGFRGGLQRPLSLRSVEPGGFWPQLCYRQRHGSESAIDGARDAHLHGATLVMVQPGPPLLTGFEQGLEASR